MQLTGQITEVEAKLKAIRNLQRDLEFEPLTSALISHVALDFSLLTTAFLCLKQSAFSYYCLAQLILPIFFFRSFGLMHECVHGSAAKSKMLNDVIGCLYGAFCFLPYYPWKLIHMSHHYWAGNVERDPVMRLVREHDPEKRSVRLLNFFWQKWLPAMAFLQHTVFWYAGYKQSKGTAIKSKNLAMFMSSYLLPIFVYAGFYKIGLFHVKNFAPGLILYLMLVEVINLPHHLKLAHFNGEKALPVWLQYSVSRSCVYPKWFARAILNNFNYHAEHHLFPKLPWYRLDEIQPKVKILVGDEYNECLQNAWIIENRKLHISDVLRSNANTSVTNVA